MSNIRSLTMLDETGDTTIVWTEDRDDEMEAIIEKKMREEKIRFFIVEPRAFGWLPPRKTEIKSFDEARKHRALAIKDEDFAAFVGEGKGDAVKTPAEPTRKARLSRSAKEIAGSQSVGVRAAAGG